MIEARNRPLILSGGDHVIIFRLRNGAPKFLGFLYPAGNGIPHIDDGIFLRLAVRHTARQFGNGGEKTLPVLIGQIFDYDPITVSHLGNLSGSGGGYAVEKLYQPPNIHRVNGTGHRYCHNVRLAGMRHFVMPAAARGGMASHASLPAYRLNIGNPPIARIVPHPVEALAHFRLSAFSVSFRMASERLAEPLQRSKRRTSSRGSRTEKTSPRPVAGRPLFRLIFTANGLDPSE